ncbi:MAG: LysM domain-containing protein, partial [Anaerolineaceae bacterium]|nr:LysM domain-containing protein [Anaerolineaceae bacterium]
MKPKRVRKGILIAVGILILIAAMIIITLKIIDIIEENKRSKSSPPVIQIQSPQAGDAFATGEPLFVIASALGRNPMQYVELWFDGASAGKVFNDQSSNGLFPAQFSVEVPEGGHTLFLRAVDQEGLTSQSIPITVYGSADMANGAVSVYQAQEGETVEGIAEEFEIDAASLKDLNPRLAVGKLPEGTQVTLPPAADWAPEDQPPADDATQTQAPAATAPQPQPGGGQPGTPLQPKMSAANPIMNAINILTRFKPPAAPTGLQVSMEDCSVTLSWMDNAEDEDQYSIWMSGLGVPARQIGSASSSAHTGRVWYKFNTPPAGIYTFWIEAENVIGSQASDPIWTGIPATQCEDYTAAYLYVSVQKFKVAGNGERVYCYISVEGAPEQRFPADDSQFFQTDASAQEPIETVFWGGLRSFVIPYPEDGAVDLQGECLVWAGGTLVSLGKFGKSLTPNEEDFSDLETIEEPNFTIWVTVQPYGWEDPVGAYTFFDPTIPV